MTRCSSGSIGVVAGPVFRVRNHTTAAVPMKTMVPVINRTVSRPPAERSNLAEMSAFRAIQKMKVRVLRAAWMTTAISTPPVRR